MGEKGLRSDEKIYMLEMESYFRESEARRKLIVSTIETSEAVAKENKIQLEWHDKRFEAAKKAYKEWLAEHL